MACIGDKTKHMCAKCVLIISVILFVMGLLTVIFGAIISGNENLNALTESEYLKNMDVEIPASGFSMAIIVGGLFVVLTAVLGCATAKIKNCLITIPFMVLAGILGLMMLIIGLLFLIVATDTEDLVSQVCTTPIAQQNGQDLATIASTQYDNAVGQLMCSTVCPCDVTY